MLPTSRHRGSDNPTAPLTPSRAAATLLVATLLCAAGCGTEAVEPVAPAGAITYYEHVAPIFVRACDGCHVAGGIAPMPLDTPEAAAKWGPAIKASTANRTMPPWLVTSDGSCGSFQDAKWLTDDEIATVGKWVDEGMWAGDKAKAPTPPEAEKTLAPEVAAGTAIELDMGVDYKPEDDKALQAGKGPSPVYDDYRCFPIVPGLDKDVFVTATEVVPGDPEVVHHVLLFSVNPGAFPVDAPDLGSNDNVMKHLQKTHSDRAGWPCYAAAGKGVLMDSLLLAWAPGAGVNHYPAGTGLKLPKGNVLVMQVHYNVQKKAALDRTRVRLEIADTVEREAWMALHDPFLFSSFSDKPKSLLPGLAEVDAEWTAFTHHLGFWVPSQATKQLEIHGVYPHMHQRGRKMRMTLDSGEGPACVTDVPNWDFNWQRMYYFDKPLRFEQGDKLRTVCTFDTSDATKPVMAGFGTSDEMCLMGLYVTTPKP